MVRLIFWTPNQLQIVVEKHEIEAKADFPEIPMYFQAFVKETNRFLKENLIIFSKMTHVAHYPERYVTSFYPKWMYSTIK